MIEVSVEWLWMMQGGNNLKIYPAIKSFETNAYFEDFEREYLEVGLDGIEYTAPKTVTNMPVLVGEVETNYAAFHPCQYTELTLIDYNDKPITIYKEESNVKDVENLEIGIVGFTNPKKYTIKANEKADTKECNLKGDKAHKNVFHYNEKVVAKGFLNINPQPKQIEFEASFPYKDVDLFDFFWLSEEKKNKVPLLPITANTCRHRHNINLKLYPDIIWEFNFFYNTSDPVWYGQTEPVYNIHSTTTEVRDNTKLGDIKGKANRLALAELRREELDKNKASNNNAKKIGVSANRYFENTLSNFGISAKVSWDQVESQELSFKIAEKYRQLLGILTGIYDLVEKISGGKEAKDASKTLSTNLIPRRNLMSFSLLPPAPSVGASWKYAPASTGVMGVELKGRFKCIPLIGGELKIDILALADKIPVYGKLVTALDIATWLAEKIAMNRLSIDYRIDLIFYASLAIDEAFFSYNDVQPKGKKLQADMIVSGTFGGRLEVSFDVKLKVTTSVEAGFEAGIKGDCYFKVTASPNADTDNVIDWTTKFSGLIVTGYFKFTSMKPKNNDKPKKFDPFKLIPSYTAAPVSMVISEGKTNNY